MTGKRRGDRAPSGGTPGPDGPISSPAWRVWARRDPASPSALRAAALVQAAEALVVLAATVLSGIDTAAGRSYQMASGIALTVIGAGCAVVLALVATGIAKARRWSRTPALLTQLFVGIVGIYLLEGHRFDWGVVAIVLAAGGFVTLLLPASLRALSGQQVTPGGKGKAGGAAKAGGGATRPR
jgi:hypothetical protein